MEVTWTEITRIYFHGNFGIDYVEMIKKVANYKIKI